MPIEISGRKGLYAIVDLGACDARGVDAVAFGRALAAAVPLFALQVRAKEATARRAHDTLAALRDVTRARGVPLFANDRADVAVAAGADGVHVGQDDLSPADVRRFEAAASRAPLRVGFSTHDEAQLARGKTEALDYVALGPVLPTRTKVNADPTIGLERARAIIDAHRIASRPVVAIGGIDLEAGAVLAAFVDAIAVVTAILPEDASPAAEQGAIARALRFARLFDAPAHPSA